MATQDQPPELSKKAFKNAQKRAAEVAGIGSSRRKSHGPLPAIELFQRENNLLSHFVRSRLTILGLDYVAHSVPKDQPLKHELLIRAGGRDEVPFLIDNSSGAKLYGGRAILAYLEKAYGKPAANGSTELLNRLGDQVQSAWQMLEESGTFVLQRLRAGMSEARARAQGA